MTFAWAERLGANELATSRPERSVLAAWKDAGYRTVVLGNVPVHLNDHLREHPEQRGQQGRMRPLSYQLLPWFWRCLLSVAQLMFS